MDLKTNHIAVTKYMNKKNFSIGIVGASGIMGAFFVSLFSRYNVQTYSWSRKSDESLEEFCSKPDIILVSVPIDTTEQIIEEIGKYIRDDQCICDVTSIKVPAMNTMKNTQKMYFGMHPMFAPPVSGKIEGQNTIFCAGNAPEQEQFIRDIFETDGGLSLKMTSKEHDEVMSIVQGLSHFFDITFIQTLKAKNIDLEKIFASRSPAYALKMMLAGRTLYQSANLYGNIQIQNPENIKTLDIFFEEAQKLYEIVQKKDLHMFTQKFDAQKKYLGKYAHTSQKESDTVIDFLAHRILSKTKPISVTHTKESDSATIGILGPANTFSHIAAKEFLGEDTKFILYPSIASIFSGYIRGEITELFIPLENLLHGSVVESIDGITKIGVPIQAVYEMKIVPALFSQQNQDSQQINEIFSHPQSLAQCSNFLEKHYPHVHITPVSSTANATQRMLRTPDSAAIAPLKNNEILGVQTVAQNIANQENNATQFAYLSKTRYEKNAPRYQGAIVFSLPVDIPGGLGKWLHAFSKRNINLTKIESRPTGESFGEYTFFITYEGKIPNEDKDEFFKELRNLSAEFTFLGEFGMY